MDKKMMNEAITEAKKALAAGDVPIGAVVVKDGRIIGRGYNTRERDHDPSGHAEINAMRDAAAHLGRWQLDGATLYVTHEPCPMCAGAMLLSHISTVVFGATEPTYGVCGSQMNLVQFPGFPNNIRIRGPIAQEACARLTRDFFQALRQSPTT